MNSNLQIFQSWLCKEYSDDVPNDIINVIEGDGIPKRWVTAASRIIHHLSEMPWYTQEKISNEIYPGRSHLPLVDAMAVLGVTTTPYWLTGRISYPLPRMQSK